jgi:dihydrofolate reductase
MRKVTFGGAVSLDSFLARADHSVDWIMWCKEAEHFMADYWKTIDTVLMGRKTYEFAVKGGQGDSYPGTKTYVFSRTLTRCTGKDVTLVKQDAVEFVRELKQQEGKDICLMGGGDFARSLFEAELIDELGLNIHPLLLGSGVPLFLPMTRQINLELTKCEQWQNGCVLVNYRVKY